MTIRRDLDILERKGLLRRVHGGPTSIRGRSYEPPFMLRSSANVAPKERIGKAAAGLLRQAKDIPVVAGASKFGHVALNAIAPLQAADRIIVDAGIELEIAEEIEAMGIDLIEV